jgi:hypothetical protein
MVHPLPSISQLIRNPPAPRAPCWLTAKFHKWRSRPRKVVARNSNCRFLPAHCQKISEESNAIFKRHGDARFRYERCFRVNGGLSQASALQERRNGFHIFDESVLRALLTNCLISSRSLTPGDDSTPLATSTPHGFVARIASAIFVGTNPPARMSGGQFC